MYEHNRIKLHVYRLDFTDDLCRETFIFIHHIIHL